MGHIAPQFWDDDKVMSLPPAGVLLFNCMIGGPQTTNLPGLYRAGPETFFHPLRCFSQPEVENAFQAILDRELAIFDPTVQLLRLPKCYRYHPVPNGNMIIGWRKTWDKLPNSQLKFDHLDSLQRLAKQKEASRIAYETHFGLIRRDSDPADYRIAGWVSSANGSRGTVPRVGTLPPSPASEKNIDYLFVPGDPEKKTKTGTGTKTGTETGTGTETDTLLQSLEGLEGEEGFEGLQRYKGLEDLEGLSHDERRAAGQRINGSRGAPGSSSGARSTPPQTNGHSVTAGKDPADDARGVQSGGDGGRGAAPVDKSAVPKRRVGAGQFEID